MDKKMMKNLERALYYELQYRNAIVSDSLSFYDINLTKDSIENDFYVKDADGKPVSCLERVDMTAPASCTEFFKRWFDLQIPDNLKSIYTEFTDIRQKLLDAFKLGKREYDIEYWSFDAFSRKIFVNQKFYMTQNEEGEIFALTVVKDYTDQKKNEQALYKKEIEQYAYKDPITGGYNYNKFKQELLRHGLAGSIICLDIHSFKVINTICGIATGDMVIKTIWECIMCALTTKENEITAHINADHFIIFLPTETEQQIVSKIKNITVALNLLSIELDIPQVQPYFGITKWKPGKRIELAYSEAVTAKHNAKQNQDENFAFFNEADTNRLIEEKQMADSFADALANDEFKIWYQPKYNPVTKKLVGAEALVRWQREEKLVPPGKFIPLFEHNGMIRTLDEYIFRAVCKQQKLWQSLGKHVVPVSINLSRVSLYYESIANQYKLITEEIGIDKDLIPIEITESAAINNIILKNVADQFYKNGFHLHMDDFGSGYSSLASLNTLHFDTLKLDKSLIDYIGNFGGDRLIEHTISLAKDLGMQVTAEGVENSSQVKFLKHNGCDSIQGYFYSKPVPKDDFEQLLEDENSQKADKEVDYLSAHLAAFRRRFLKASYIKFIVNLSKRKFIEISKKGDWGNYQDASKLTYKEGLDIIAEKYLNDEDQKKFYDFMDKDKIIKSFKGPEETKVMYFNRKYCGNDEKSVMSIVLHIFKVENSDDLWAFFTMAGNTD